MILFLLSTGVFLLSLYLVLDIHRSPDLPGIACRSDIPGDRVPLISVIIPARNEEETIARCLSAIMRQTYPRFEVIVVDDRSTDRTLSILSQHAQAHPELQVVEGRELPRGWVGKPFALHQGVQYADGEWYCFLDADTYAEPELLSSAYTEASSRGIHCLTLLTRQIMEGFWEKAVLPVVFSGLMYGFPAQQVNDPDHPRAIANGQFILITREAYEAIGGHQAVQGRIDEDKALAEQVKAGGWRLYMADGRRLACTRMYRSLSGMWRGWTKNMFLGMRDRLALLAFGGLIALLGAVGLPLWWGLVLSSMSIASWLLSALTILEVTIVTGVLVVFRARIYHEMGVNPWYSLTLPLGAAIFGAMMITSAYNVLTGRGVVWKNRRYHQS